MRGIRTDKGTEMRIMQLYRQGLSEFRVARKLTISRQTVHSILVRNNESRRNMSEAHTIYPKRDFSGDPFDLARIVGFMEDCGARYNHSGRLIQIGTNSTHPAQMKSFNEIFGQFGHVGTISTYNKTQSYYQWHLYVLLNRSFDFVIMYKANPLRFLSEMAENGYEIFRIASLTDAEGHIGVEFHHGSPRPVLSIANNNRRLLEWTRLTLGGLINRYRDCYALVFRGRDAVEAIRRIPVTHEEKVAAKELILRHYDNGGIGLPALWEYQALRRRINEEVRLCKMQARLEYSRRHGRPHPLDPDQTIPRN